MNDPLKAPHALFEGRRLLVRGELRDVVREAVARAGTGADGRPLLLLDDRSGQSVDLDLRGDVAQVLERLRARFPPADAAGVPATRERGRPRLGVVAREVTLLPRHWEWLAAQPGGASAALRRLVEQARRADDGAGDLRQRREAQYQAMLALAGDLPGFEEASRALFAGDTAALAMHFRQWPGDVGNYLASLSANDAG
ncbi:MAG: hypothetical protein ABS96_04145 [Lysobacteraceae bacterium SCN 69-123]|uniref:DUF2239 family protein n=1 Tax=Stenotrophomonas acidaminiphila TaxID=128780 RepID=UPI00086ACEBE|nr:DUF2239 family protein [Stenotrophomonas acidaminiphila]MDF9440797.1 DUF2239 family protein [Stenotrophomonas acidaminiphila]ODU47268.1 MAG: hypothetical protein ABS96_04145 [Xanthomonadaceae bacterium SCN 69-123]OJY79938.1 MAG: hypothetical protein BGP18_13375 [Stenotrophomonas sp. 69-14]